MATASEVNIADSIAYARERERQAEADRRLAEFPAFAMAELIASGLTGFALAGSLTREFPALERHHVYLAIGLGTANMQADLTEKHLELAALRNDGARR